MDMIENSLLNLKANSLRLRSQSIDSRLDKLKKLEVAIESSFSDIVNALKLDFNKPEAETYLTEIYPALKELEHTQHQLKNWARTRVVNNPLSLSGTTCYIVPEPKGTVLLIGPWNYPFQLIIIPLISAIAAGNTVAIKPSEYTPHINLVLKKIIQTAFLETEVLMFEGDSSVTQELLKFPFDHIFFTGSTAVGKIVMRAAAENLSSITLELGGKSPCIVEKSANLKLAAEKIAWGKFINAGQTCIAPDYIFVDESIKDQFLILFKEQINKFYSDKNVKADLARMVSPRHFSRIKSLIEQSQQHGDKLLEGGIPNETQLEVPATLISLKDLASPLMDEELFGPLAPVVSYRNFDEVIHYINSHPKPLAAYLFSQSDKMISKFELETTSGGLVINDCLLHLLNPDLPFGGVNSSGIGRYHGEFGFKEFSHEKAVLKQGMAGRLLKVLYPPYTPFKLKIIKAMTRFKI